MQILIKALDAFILMKTRFYLENIFLGCTRYIPGISKEKVYTWYIPGIYHEKTFWGFQMLAVNTGSRGTGTVTARRNRTAGAQANCLRWHRVGGRGWRRTVTVTCASEKPAIIES